MLTANEIRRKYIEYFEKHGHTEVVSASLVPKDDPSLLFTNSGMVQFKRTFCGQEKRPYSRAVTSQKCLRVGGKHNDLENVGRTARHHTFFEMLGNFSFGDYFKSEAIDFAWTFITEVLNIPKEKLYVTIFLDDDEAHDLWVKNTGIDPSRIYRLGEKDNFWTMGDTGPCGPCSELHVDQGEHMCCGPDCGIGVCDCDRYLEIWNLVFMQFEQHEDGSRTNLPHPSIDTGMGLERVAAVCQGVMSNYDTDIFQTFIQHMASLASVKYGDNEDSDTALRVVADHSRAMAFMLSDGILPSNEGRGYVLRRLIRRAYRFGHLIGMKEPFLYKTSAKVVEVMGEDYPELRSRASFIEKTIKSEEERFAAGLEKGLHRLEDIISQQEAEGKKIIEGQAAFTLYDTYGFPIDIINDIAEQHGFSVDEAGFIEAMAEQKNRARAAWKGTGAKDLLSRFQPLLDDGLHSEFIGDGCLNGVGRVVALLDADLLPVESLSLDDVGYLVTDTTPFYGASGGQEGDTGYCQSPSGKVLVTDTLKPTADLTVHNVKIEEGQVLLDQELTLHVTEGRRLAIARNHTATHLVHTALRNVLGDHVQQAGSLVSEDRLRFDFTHNAALTADEILQIEESVNAAILQDMPLDVAHMTQKEALDAGAIALFGEKYGDSVRVVSMSNEAGLHSMELCGGTHLSRTGQAGAFCILSEGGISAGVRRIEAITAWTSLAFLQEQRNLIKELGLLCKAQPSELLGKVEALQKEVRALRKERDKGASGAVTKGRPLMEEVRKIGDISALLVNVGTASIRALREIMDDVRSKMPSGVACLVAEEGDKAHILLYVSKDLHDRFTAPALIKQAAGAIGGSGGGRPDMAQAGGDKPTGLAEVLKIVEGALSE